MREAKIQSDYIQSFKAKGYWALKFETPSENGMPDLILLSRCEQCQQCKADFAEIKADGKKPGPLQVLKAHRLQKRVGAKVYFLNSKGKIEDIKKPQPLKDSPF